MNKVKLSLAITLAGFLGLVANSVLHADATPILLPISDGLYGEWTPSVAGPHYEMVNETTCNIISKTDYNFTSTLDTRDSYLIDTSSIPNGSTVTSIAISPCASAHRKGMDTTIMDVFYRFNDEQSDDAGDYHLPRTPVPTQLKTTVFDSLSYAKTASSSLEIGAVYSSGRRGVRLSNIHAEITFSTLASSSSPTPTETSTPTPTPTATTTATPTATPGSISFEKF